MMNNEFVECMKVAEEKNYMSFVIKGNRRKRESEDLQKELSVIEGQISDMQGMKRKLYHWVIFWLGCWNWSWDIVDFILL